MTQYLADYERECSRCGYKPCVAVHSPEGTGESVHFTGLCGIDFFQDRSMIDPELWNEPKEATE